MLFQQKSLAQKLDEVILGGSSARHDFDPAQLSVAINRPLIDSSVEVSNAALKRFLASRPQHVQIGDQPIEVPIGVSPAKMLKIVDYFKQILQLKNSWFDGLVIFGSRTHHRYGNLPDESSDLDVLTIFPTTQTKPLSEDEVEASNHLVQSQLRSLGDHPIVNHAPRAAFWGIQIGKEKLTDPLYTSATTEIKLAFKWVEFSNQSQLLRLVRLGGSHLVKQAWMKESEETFNKGAVFLFRDTVANRKTATVLRERGYRNVVLITL